MFTTSQHAGLNRLCAVLYVLAAVLAFLTVSTVRANAATAPDCVTAHRHPHGIVAAACRDHGWTVTRRLVVDPHAVVRFSRLPACDAEDASAVLPCSWNFAGQTTGNGVGLSFWMNARGRTRYVWPATPVRGDRWTFIRRPLARVLAQGDQPTRPIARHEGWTACVVHFRRGWTIIRCADGLRLRL